MTLACVAEPEKQNKVTSTEPVATKWAVYVVKGLVFVKHPNGMCFAVHDPLPSIPVTYVPCRTDVTFVEIE